MDDPKCRCWNPARSFDTDCPAHGQFAVQRSIIDQQEGPDEQMPGADFPDWEMGGEG